MKNVPLIVGAGPVGLAAALFLARGGVKARVIDKLAEPTQTSKALAINPRTLDLLEPTGVTRRMLELGRRIEGATFRSGEKVLAKVEFAELDHRYAFMLALSQATTERLLTEALAELGVVPEREVELLGSNKLPTGHAELRHGQSEQIETLEAPWIAAADGGQSEVRSALNLEFPGSRFDHDWFLIDIPLESDLEPNRVHGTFLEGGVLAQIPVVTGQEQPGQPQLWRLISNLEDPISLLGKNSRPVGPPQWTSRFRVSHRMVERMNLGRVYLLGDAAHLHSPVGARGMNLGIEEAWVFAQLIHRGELNRYHALRHEVDQAVVRRIERITRTIRGTTPWAQATRRFLLPNLMRLKAVRQTMLRAVTGLDQVLPF